MINCPKCGTANPENNLFCDRCDTMLPPTGGGRAAGGLRCPMCGKTSPEGSQTCTSCGARLAPITGALPQEPARPAPAATPAARKATPPPPAPVPQPQQPAAEDDWLSRLRGAMPDTPAPQEDIPDWLRGEPVAPAGVEPEFDLAARLSGTAPSPTDIPDWLSQSAPATSADVEPESSAFDLAARLGGTAPSPANVPDWLSQSAPAAPAAPLSDQVPDWLSQFSPTATSAPQAAPMPPAPVPSEADIPDWLKPLAPAATLAAAAKPAPKPSIPATPTPAATTPAAAKPAPKPSVPAAPPPAEAEIPNWLQDLVPREAKPGAPSATPTAEAELPDWLKELAPAAATPSAQVPSPDEAWLGPSAAAGATLAQDQTAGGPPAFVEPAVALGAEPEMPDWLREIAPAAPSSPTFIGEAEPALGQVPSWLDASQAGAQPAPVQAELPDWLQELQGQAPAEASALPSGAPRETWLQELAPAETPATLQQVFTEEPESAPAPMAPAVPAAAVGLVATQLPAWLQKLAPKGEAVPEEEKEPVETEGILAGVRGPLQIAAVIAQQVSGEPRRLRPEIPAGDLASAGALQELLARGAAVIVRRETESRAQRLLGGVERGIAFLLIAIAVLLPMLFDQMVSDMKLVRPPALAPAALELYQQIDQLKPDSTVFVSFDYDATQSAEMDTQARALLTHLAARKVRVQVVSLYPTGPAIAQAIIRQTVPVTDQARFQSLGYKPGQDVGVVSILGEVKAASALVIELAASPDTVRWWVEQVAAQPDQRPTLLAGVSAAAEPMSLPYYYSHHADGSRQIAGLLSGITGATAYRLQLRQAFPQYEKESDARLLAPLASVGLASLILAVWMVIGSVRYLRSGGRRK